MYIEFRNVYVFLYSSWLLSALCIRLHASGEIILMFKSVCKHHFELQHILNFSSMNHLNKDEQWTVFSPSGPKCYRQEFLSGRKPSLTLLLLLILSRYYANHWVMLRTDYFLLETGRDIKQEVAQEQDV